VLGTISKARDRKNNNVYCVYDDGDEGWADYPDEVCCDVCVCVCVCVCACVCVCVCVYVRASFF
jgi:hypothetical protein